MYIRTARPICLVLERQEIARAFSRACAKTGNRIAARMAIMAMTTSSSMSVKAERRALEPGAVKQFMSTSPSLASDDSNPVHVMTGALAAKQRRYSMGVSGDRQLILAA